MSALYAGLVAAVFEDDVITPDDHERLRAYRAKHRITPQHHETVLQALGYSIEAFEYKVLQGEEIDAYAHVVAATLEETESEPEEAGVRLAAYREVHHVDAVMAAKALKQLGMTPAQFEARCHKPSEGAVETYAAMLHTLLLRNTVSEADELRREEYRKAHGISDTAHVQAFRFFSSARICPPTFPNLHTKPIFTSCSNPRPTSHRLTRAYSDPTSSLPSFVGATLAGSE